MTDFFKFCTENQALVIVLLFTSIFSLRFVLMKFTSIRLGKDGITLDKSNAESISELKKIILDLQQDNKKMLQDNERMLQDNKKLLQRLNDIEMKLQAGVIVNKYTLLRMESERLYHRCINKQRDLIKDEISDSKIDQMRLFREIFSLGLNDNDYINWEKVVSNVGHVVRHEAERLIEKNHFDYKELTTDGLFREKWEKYKDKKATDTWDLCMQVMAENFSLHNFGIKLEEIGLKAKAGFYEIFAASNSRILEAYLSLNLQKDAAFEKFRQDHGIEDEFIDQEFF